MEIADLRSDVTPKLQMTYAISAGDFEVVCQMLREDTVEVFPPHQLSLLRMTKMKKFFVRLWKEEEGQDLIEYGLLLVLVALLSVTFITSIGTSLSKIFSNAATAMQSAAGG